MSKITLERLQEIKNEVDSAKLDRMNSDTPDNSWCAWVSEVVPELIAAVVEAQVEVKKLNNALDSSMEGYGVQERRVNRKVKRITELNKELKAVQAELVEVSATFLEEQTECRRQLAEAKQIKDDDLAELIIRYMP